MLVGRDAQAVAASQKIAACDAPQERIVVESLE